MQHILVDSARARRSAKRDAGLRVMLDPDLAASPASNPEPLDLDDSSEERVAHARNEQRRGMNPELRKRVESLCQAALQRDPGERARFLDEVCHGDENLRREVDSRLQQDLETGVLRETPERELEVARGASAGSQLLAAGARLGPYEVLAHLGSGGMGAVYRARDVRLDRCVALKVLLPSALSDPARKQRFLVEARAVSALNHPNIVTLFDVISDAGRDVLVFEHVEGATLDRQIPENGMPVEQVLRIAVQIADAMAAAHSAGIVHRDLKPGNIIVMAGGTAKILDFGLAKRAPITTGASGSTQTLVASELRTAEGAILGTVSYMSPEQAEGKPVDARSDIFSFGVVLYEMLSGRKCFQRDTTVATLAAILRDDPEPLSRLLSGVPADLERIVGECLRKKKDQRKPDMAGLKVELEEILDRITRRRETPGLRVSSVAVLPFADFSPDHSLEYFCEGMSEEIIHALAGLEGLDVSARTSSFQFRGRNIDIREVGRSLKVTAVLEGSVRKSGDKLRVTAQLIRTEDGNHLWSKRFDREMKDVFAIQDEIADAVAESFQLTPEGDQKLSRRETNLEAYQYYLQGRYFWNRRPGEVVFKALECFQRAAALDPGFAAAQAGIADVYATLGSWESGGLPPMEALPKAREAALRALEIDSRSPEALASLAYVAQHFEWDLKAAETWFRRSIELNPAMASNRHWYSHCLIAAGRVPESLAESKKIIGLEPMDLLLNVHLAWHYQMARQAEETVEQSRRVIYLDPAFHWGHYFLGCGLELQKRYAEAVQAFREAERISSGHPVMVAWLGHVYALAGEHGKAAEAIAALRRAGAEKGMFAYEIAMIHNAMGDRDQAFQALENARQQRSGWISYLLVDPRLDTIRDDPRFAELRKRVQLRRS